MAIPREIQGQKYVSLITFRKSGARVPTAVWFGEQDGKLYVMSSSRSGKYKRIRNSAQVRIAPCNMRGKITGPEFEATARILLPPDHSRARETINRKYWAARIPFLWRNTDAYFEISL
jgi:PPOX class probable F420-dependent enzyme